MKISPRTSWLVVACLWASSTSALGDTNGTAVPATSPEHEGLTVEAGVGGGGAAFPDAGDHTYSAAVLALGAGAWLRSNLALTGRVASTQVFGEGWRMWWVVAGPNLQYWVSDRFWIGGGVGLGVVAPTEYTHVGVGLDLRAGYTFHANATNAVNASVELTPGIYTHLDDGSVYYARRVVGISLLVGYQMM